MAFKGKYISHIIGYALISMMVFSCAGTAPTPNGANTVKVLETDSPEQIIAKAVSVLPSERQVSAMDNEYIAFVHFGPNTFTGREWGTGSEDPKVFSPKTVDTDQWCRVISEAGMNMVILTVKHHDGFVLWQSRYTTHGVMSSPYMDGKGDILRQLSESCRRYGLKLGIYLSPADLYQMEDGGLYGNGSSASLRTIPKPVQGRPFKEGPTFEFTVDDYNEYFLSQMYEILTEYGPISEVWLDGAHPRRKGGQQYDYTAWRELIRTLVPDATVFGREDIRWCGNEAGQTRDQEWNVITYRENPDSMVVYHDITDPVLGTREVLLSEDRPYYLHYQPAEFDTSIRDGWFYRNDDEQAVRTAENIFDIYERTVGGNGIFLLNIPPNTSGVFSERDVKSLTEAGQMIRDTYGNDLLSEAKGPKKVLDGDRDTFTSSDEIVIRTKKEITFNRLQICEPVHLSGERIESFSIDIWDGSVWRTIHEGTNVGRRHIARFDAVTTDRIKVRLTSKRAEPKVCGVSAFMFMEK